MRISVYHKFCNINLHNIIHSLISWNLTERMCVVQVSHLVVTCLSLISRVLSLMQTTKEVNPHPHIAPCVNMWSVNFLFLFLIFFLCHLLNVGACMCQIARELKAKWSGPHQQTWEDDEFKFHSVMCYTNSLVSCIRVNTTIPRNITCTLVATCVIQSLECSLSCTNPCTFLIDDQFFVSLNLCGSELGLSRLFRPMTRFACHAHMPSVLCVKVSIIYGI